MKRSRLVSQVVFHVDHQAVTDIHVDLGDWPFAVDANHWPVFLSIRISAYPANVEIVSVCLCSDQCGQEQHTRGEETREESAMMDFPSHLKGIQKLDKTEQNNVTDEERK